MHIQFFSYLAKTNAKPYSRLECPCSNVLSCSVLYELRLIPSGDWQPRESAIIVLLGDDLFSYPLLISF